MPRVTKPTLNNIEHETILSYITKHMEWSRETFGDNEGEVGQHTEGLLKHIESEVQEIRKSPSDLMEYVDILILVFDAMWRRGFTPREIVAAIIEKQNINKLREYPKITSASEPTEHVRDE